jgi:hypothetical protein
MPSLPKHLWIKCFIATLRAKRPRTSEAALIELAAKFWPSTYLLQPADACYHLLPFIPEETTVALSGNKIALNSKVFL